MNQDDVDKFRKKFPLLKDGEVDWLIKESEKVNMQKFHADLENVPIKEAAGGYAKSIVVFENYSTEDRYRRTAMLYLLNEMASVFNCTLEANGSLNRYTLIKYVDVIKIRVRAIRFLEYLLPVEYNEKADFEKLDKVSDDLLDPVSDDDGDWEILSTEIIKHNSE